MHEATMEYRSQVAAALAERERALTTITHDMYEEELAAVGAASRRDEASPPEHDTRAAAVRQWWTAVESTRHEAWRGVGTVERVLVEQWQRAWLDRVEKENDANQQYRCAVQETYRLQDDGVAVAGGVGDEGIALGFGPTWPVWPTAEAWPVTSSWPWP